jgi:hypothetical protein
MFIGWLVATLLSGVCPDDPIFDPILRRSPLAVTPISEVTLYGCMYASRTCVGIEEIMPRYRYGRVRRFRLSMM